jgi:hypothetical protein
MRIFVVFLTFSRKIPGYFLQIDHNRHLPNSSLVKIDDIISDTFGTENRTNTFIQCRKYEVLIALSSPFHDSL